MLKKLWMMFIVFVSSTCSFGGYVYPTFNYDRWPWMNWENNDVPVIMESGFKLGLTNPHAGSTQFDFIFDISSSNVIFDIDGYNNQIFNKGEFSILLSNGAVEIYGMHQGPGDPLNGLNAFVSGYGTIHVFEKDSSSGVITHAGHIYVVPEPSTMSLLLTGFLITYRIKLWRKENTSI